MPMNRRPAKISDGQIPSTKRKPHRLRGGLMGEDRGILILLGLGAIIFFIIYYFSWKPLAKSARELTQEITQQQGSDRSKVSLIILKHLDQESHLGFWREAALHLSVALLVSLVVILAVERYSRRQFRKEAKRQRDAIAKNVWRALLGSFISDEIVGDITAIAKEQIIKKNCIYSITFSSHRDLKAELILGRELTYEVFNIKNHTIYHTVISGMGNHYGERHLKEENGSEYAIPRYTKFEVDEEKIPLSKVVSKDEKGLPLNLSYPLILERGKSKKIHLCSEQNVPLQGENNYVQLVPLVGLTVVIRNQMPDEINSWLIQLNHPSFREFDGENVQVFAYPGALLPGQGFSISWEPKSPYQNLSSRTANPLKETEPARNPNGLDKDSGQEDTEELNPALQELASEEVHRTDS